MDSVMSARCRALYFNRLHHSAKVVLKNHYSTKKQNVKKTFDKMIFIDTKKRKAGCRRLRATLDKNRSADVMLG